MFGSTFFVNNLILLKNHRNPMLRLEYRTYFNFDGYIIKPVISKN